MSIEKRGCIHLCSNADKVRNIKDFLHNNFGLTIPHKTDKKVIAKLHYIFLSCNYEYKMTFIVGRRVGVGCFAVVLEKCLPVHWKAIDQIPNFLNFLSV